MKSILLTGVAGFIGSHVGEGLLKDARFDSYQLIGLDNFDPFYSREIKENNLAELKRAKRFKFIEGFSGDQKLLKSLFEENQIVGVMHLAARAGVGPSLKDPAAYGYLNLEGTQALLHLAGQKKVEKFVFASSSSVYGSDSRSPYSEDQMCLAPLSPYAATKRAGELLAWNAQYIYAMPLVALRFFTVYGPRQRPEMAIAKFTRMILAGETIELYGDGKLSRDFTYIDDIVSGVLNSYLYKTGEPHFEIINLGNHKPCSVSELIQMIEIHLGRKAVSQSREIPKGEMIETCADIQKAMQILKFKPKTTLLEGLAKYIAWSREGIT